MHVRKDQYADSASSGLYTHLRSMSRSHVVLLGHCVQWFAFNSFKMREESKMQMLMFNFLDSQSFYLFRGLKKKISLLWSHPNVPFYH